MLFRMRSSSYLRAAKYSRPGSCVISALKRTEQALRDSEARMRAFMDHAPMLIYLKDIEGRYQLVNREFERIEGVSEDQLRGKTVFDVLPREHAELFAASDDDK